MRKRSKGFALARNTGSPLKISGYIAQPARPRSTASELYTSQPCLMKKFNQPSRPSGVVSQVQTLFRHLSQERLFIVPPPPALCASKPASPAYAAAPVRRAKARWSTSPARFVPFGPLFPELQPECCLLLRRFLRYRPAVAPYTTGIATNRTRLIIGAIVETATPRSASIGETAVRTAT